MENISRNRVQIFNYKVINLEPIENLVKYKEHRRLKVFYNKGLKCVNYDECGREGEVLTHGIDKKGNLHIDLCTKDLYPMTVDHIKPKSRGGRDVLNNLNPMCSGCNTKKGDMYNGVSLYNTRMNKEEKKKPKGRKVYGVKVGDVVYKGKKKEFLGKVIDIRPNLHHPRKVMSVQIEGRAENSLYNIESVYMLRE